MKKIRILYNGSCYPTNIGNAFVDMGAMYSLKQAIGSLGEVFQIGRMSNYLFLMNRKLENTIATEEIADCDYVVMGGMVLCVDHLRGAAKTLQGFAEKGTRIIIAGGGAGTYTEQEVKDVHELLKGIPIYGFISRDEYTFEKYKDLAQYSYNGIDSAFFVGDSFKPIDLNIPDFVIFNFDTLPEQEIDYGDYHIIRTHHSCLPEMCRPDFFLHPNTMISDLASDYLNLYSRTKNTYTDRIHASIATLAFGNCARMYFKDGDMRIHMFHRLGIPEIGKMSKSLDMKFLNEEKKRQINFLQKILLDEIDKKDIDLKKTVNRGISEQEVPECSILLIVSKENNNIKGTIDSLLSQTVMNLELNVIDFSTEKVTRKIADFYIDNRIHFTEESLDTQLSSILGEIKARFVTCSSPDVIYEPNFLYELKKCLQENIEFQAVKSNWIQTGFKRKGSSEEVSKGIMNNLGYCFLARTESIIKGITSGVGVFNQEEFHFPIGKDSQIYQLPDILGKKRNPKNINPLKKIIRFVKFKNTNFS